MGYKLNKSGMNQLLASIKDDYTIYAPVCFKNDGIYSDTDMIRYQSIETIDEVVFDKKSNFSFKEVLFPISQTLFYFTEDMISEPKENSKKAIVLLRHCDMHALKRLDTMFLNTGETDIYYKHFRDHVKFMVIGCQQTFENCFCVSLNTNISTNFDYSLDVRNNEYYIHCNDHAIEKNIEDSSICTLEVVSDHVLKNEIQVTIPKNLSAKVAFSKIWDEYDTRCIACGRCNFVCPTCTCYTMQDIFYQDNARVGERKRVHASCMVDGYSDVAGGGSCRKRHGERMRFKVLHKVYDYKQRFNEQMCTGCGRCDDACPEYISFSNAINKLEGAMEEINKDEK